MYASPLRLRGDQSILNGKPTRVLSWHRAALSRIGGRGDRVVDHCSIALSVLITTGPSGMNQSIELANRSSVVVTGQTPTANRSPTINTLKREIQIWRTAGEIVP